MMDTIYFRVNFNNLFLMSKILTGKLQNKKKIKKYRT